MSTGTILIIAIVLIAAYAIYLYNDLVRLRNRFRNAFSQIDVQLQRRHELIPNLVEVAKGYLKHEHDTLTEVTKARNTAEEKRNAASGQPEDAALVGALASAESALSGAMGKFNVVMEAYPDLKADQQMRDLHDELATTENRVAFSRQAYSDAVMRYNVLREQFPSNLIANRFHFQEADLFELEAGVSRAPVKVSFA